MKRSLKFIWIFVSVISLSACNTFSKDNTMPPSPLVDFAPSVQVNTLWSVKVGHGAGKYYLRLNPGHNNQAIFAANYDGTVSAVSLKTGEILWSNKLNAHLTSGIDVCSGRLFVGTEDGNLMALKADTGDVVWTAPVASEILATPTTTGDMVIVKSLGGTLTALAQSDGRELWRFTQAEPDLILHAASQPVVAGGIVVAGFSDGKVAALKASNGRALWTKTIVEPQGSTDIERMVDIDVTPIVVQGVVYIATYQGSIAALDLKTGRLIWRHRISAYSGVTADYQHLYITDDKSYLWCFDEDSGAVIWRQTQLSGRMLTGPALLGDYIVVADGYGYVHWLAKSNGRFVARVPVVGESGTFVSPLVLNNTVYVYTQNGTLFAFRASK